MKTNSNSYTIIYSAILVVIVAFLLAFVYTALKPMQDANVALDQKKQILNSLNLRNLSNEEAEKTYNEFVKEQQDQERVYYKCSIKGKTVYVFPLKGMGLWGGISGYVAIEGSDMNKGSGAGRVRGGAADQPPQRGRAQVAREAEVRTVRRRREGRRCT